MLNVRQVQVAGTVVTPSLPGVPETSEPGELSIHDLCSTAGPSARLPSLRAAAQQGLLSPPGWKEQLTGVAQGPWAESDREQWGRWAVNTHS